MIAADTSSLVAYFNGVSGRDVDRVAAALAASHLVLPPAVVTEILSDPLSGPRLEATVQDIQTLSTDAEYWIRASLSRRRIIKAGLKAKLGDTLIAQSCIDHDVPLITRDNDFRHFAKHCGLKLA